MSQAVRVCPWAVRLVGGCLHSWPLREIQWILLVPSPPGLRTDMKRPKAPMLSPAVTLSGGWVLADTPSPPQSQGQRPELLGVKLVLSAAVFLRPLCLSPPTAPSKISCILWSDTALGAGIIPALSLGSEVRSPLLCLPLPRHINFDFYVSYHQNGKRYLKW